MCGILQLRLLFSAGGSRVSEPFDELRANGLGRGGKNVRYAHYRNLPSSSSSFPFALSLSKRSYSAYFLSRRKSPSTNSGRTDGKGRKERALRAHVFHFPFALSLSKRSSLRILFIAEEEPFDELRANGLEVRDEPRDTTSPHLLITSSPSSRSSLTSPTSPRSFHFRTFRRLCTSP